LRPPRPDVPKAKPHDPHIQPDKTLSAPKSKEQQVIERIEEEKPPTLPPEQPMPTEIYEAEPTPIELIEELQVLETPSTMPLNELQDLIGVQGRPTPPFHYEPGILDVNKDETSVPIITKVTERYPVRKM
jgi:hypothetical protein